MAKRPEQMAPAEIVYNFDEAQKYQNNTRMINIQREMTERAIEILAIPAGCPRLILDIGAGTGISGGVLSEYGHMWVGCDISRGMLEVAASNDENEGDLV